MNYTVFVITDVTDVELGRKRALQRVIDEEPKYEDLFDGEDIDSFAEKHGIRILNETPYVKFDEKQNRYRVDVAYKVNMD